MEERGRYMAEGGRDGGGRMVLRKGGKKGGMEGGRLGGREGGKEGLTPSPFYVTRLSTVPPEITKLQNKECY